MYKYIFMSSYAVERNLPIFNKKQIIRQEDRLGNVRYYIQAKLGSDSFLGVMSNTPRKEYFAYITKFNDREGFFRIGKLEYTKVNSLKLSDDDTILVEVIPNREKTKCGFGILYSSEFVPSYSGSNLKFTNEDIKMSFVEWLKFLSNNE